MRQQPATQRRRQIPVTENVPPLDCSPGAVPTAGAAAVVAIVSGEVAEVLRDDRPAAGSVAVFPVSDALRALSAVRELRPQLLLLQQSFILTSRGAAFVAAVKQAPDLAGTEMRMLVPEDLPVTAVTETLQLQELITASRLFEEWGTRRVPRYPCRGQLSLLVNGHHGELLDLSRTGAQVVAPLRLLPEQSVRLILTGEEARTLCRGLIAWSSARPLPSGLEYQAGVSFQHADAHVLQLLCTRLVPERDRGPDA